MKALHNITLFRSVLVLCFTVMAGIPTYAQCRIFEVCQPQQAKKVLEENMSVSTALPCRISIFGRNGKTVLATMKPTAMLAMFDTPALKDVAPEVEDTIVKIRHEAAAG